MNKSKDKHHPPEEAKKNVRATDSPAPAGVEPAGEAPSGQEAPSAAEPGKLQKAEEEIVQLKDQLLRLRADFENYRKRVLREKGEIYENANEALMLELLPVIDHLHLALKSAKEHQTRRDTGPAHSPGSPRPELGTKAEASERGEASERAKAGQADQTFQEGIRMIFDQLLNTLLKYGLKPYDSEKRPFDPNLHEAISCLSSETEPEGTILAQSRQGYRFNNKMLRPAQVVVSSGPTRPERAEANSQQPAED